MMLHFPSSPRPLSAAPSQRRAMQLLELVVSLATASILMAGISAAMVISKRTLDSVSLQAGTAASAQGGIQLLQNDLREARQVNNRTATSIELTVPDRNNDGVAESVRYRWNAAGGPLETSSDGTNWRAVTPSLSSMQLNWRSREPQSIESVTPLDGSGRVSYMNVASNSRSDWARSLSIAAPAGTLKGDACVAIVATAGDPGNIKADGNWNKISQNEQANSVNLGVWYTTNAPANTTLTWSESTQAIGAVVHLTGNSSDPYAGSANLKGLGQLPAPALSGSHAQEFVVRALAGIGPGVLSDTPLVANHSTILLRQVDVAYSPNDLTLAVVGQSVPNTTIDAAYFQFAPASLLSCTSTVALRP